MSSKSTSTSVIPRDFCGTPDVNPSPARRERVGEHALPQGTQVLRQPRIRPGLAPCLCVLLALALPEHAGAAPVTWIGGNVDWVDDTGNANWNPADEPDTDDEAIFNTANAVNLGSDNSILALTMSGGIDLKTNGYDLTINGLLQLSGSSTNFFVGGSASLASIDSITINSAGAVNIDGGQITVVEETGFGLIDINAGGTLAGYGTLRFDDGLGVVTTQMNNNGTLSAQSKFGLFIGTPPAETFTVSAYHVNARVDLDGSGEAGAVKVSRNQTLDIGIPPSDAFNGTINMYHNSTLSIASGWIMAGGGFDADNGEVTGLNPIAADTSYIAGGTFTQTGGTITVVDNDGSLQFNAAFSQGGGNLVNNGLVVFHANATIGAGANFTMPTTSSSLRVDPGVTVNIDQPDFNTDGSGASTNVLTVGSGGILDLDLGAGADEDIQGTLVLNGGELDVTTADNTWSIQGPLNIGAATGLSQINGETVSFFGAAVSVGDGSSLDLNAVSVWENSASLSIGSGSTVEMNTNTLSGITSITGAGTLRMLNPTTVDESSTIAVNTFDWDGTVAGTMHTINDGVSLTINSPNIDSDGNIDDSITLGSSGSSLTVNGPASWEMRGTFNTNAADLGVATLGGTSRLVLASATGILNANGDTVISAPFTFGAGSSTNVAASALVTLTTSNARFDGGAVTGSGTLRVNGTSSVVSNTTVDVSTFDWDGSGAGTLQSISDGATFSINSANFDDDGDMDDPLTIGGNGATLNVSGVASWTMLHTLTTNPADTGLATIGGSARLVLSSATGILNANGDTTIAAPFTFGAGSTTNVAAPALLTLSAANARFEGGAIAGAGALRIGNSSSATANTSVAVNTFDWDGTGSGSLHTIADGVSFAITSPVFDDDGDMDDPLTIGGNGVTLTVSGPASWTMRNTLTSNPGAAGTATIGGTSRLVLTSASAMAFNVPGNTRVTAPVTFGTNSTTTVTSPATLTVIGDAIHAGGVITGSGNYQPPAGSHNTVTADSTISTANFNFDAGVWVVQSGAQLTVDVTDYDPDFATNAFNSTITLNGGGARVTTGDAAFVMDGILNLNWTDTMAYWAGGDTLQIGNDAGTLSAHLNVAGGFTCGIYVPVDFKSDAAVDIAAGSSLLLARATTFNPVNGAINAGFVGGGELVTSDAVFVNEATTINMPGGSLDLDGRDSTGNTIHVDAPLVVNVASMADFGAANTSDTNILEIDSQTAGTSGSLAVNLDNPAAEWTLTALGVMNLLNDATEATLLAGSALNAAGIMNVTGDVRSDARLDISGTLNILTAGEPFRLSGGDGLTTPNTIAGGTINGPGILGADVSSSLTGYGTIAANASIDFDSTASLLADNGTLVVNGTIVDAHYVGTNDTDGILQIVSAWDSAAATTVFMQGGELKGGAITVNNAAGIHGHGLVSSRVINNTRLEAYGAGKTLVFATLANDNDWDGGASNGYLLANTGATLEIRDNLNFSFSGIVQALSAATVFVNGFPLTLAGTSILSLNDGTYRQSVGIGSTISGDVKIGSGTSTITTDGASGGITLSATSVTTLTGNLLLDNATTLIQSGAGFSGAGRLVNLANRQLQPANLAVVNVFVENRGRLQPGGVNVVARNDFLDFVQTAGGKLEIDLKGKSLGSFDRVLVNGGAQLAGDLLLTISGGYTPAVGDTMTILTAPGSVSGTFNPLVQPAGMPSGTAFKVNYGATTVQLEVISATPFDLWIDSFTTLTDPADKTKAANPDRDKLNNWGEFALDGNPASGVSTGKVATKVAPVGGSDALTITFPVRAGTANDGGDPAGGPWVLRQPAEGVIYTIQASDDLAGWLLDVGEVTGADALAIQGTMPALNAGWVYRTFRSPGTVAGDDAEYLRVIISE